MNLTGKHILITGSSKGIGKAITDHCILAGAICHQVSRTQGYDITNFIVLDSICICFALGC